MPSRVGREFLRGFFTPVIGMNAILSLLLTFLTFSALNKVVRLTFLSGNVSGSFLIKSQGPGMSLNHMQIQSVPFADWLKVPCTNLGGRIADILPLKIGNVHFPSFQYSESGFSI